MNAQEIIGQARAEGRTLLTEVEAKELLSEAGVPVVETKLAHSADEAALFAQQLGFPVALKIVSPDIVHKSDIGGVKLDLGTPQAVQEAYEQIMDAVRSNAPQARVTGVSVQAMAAPGVEVVIGMSTDPTFGPVLMFGIGGILVELLKDVSFRVVPLLPRDAKEMVREIKAYPLLEGYRGQGPVKVSVLEELLLKMSSFVENRPEIKEIDLNPIRAYEDGVLAVDARVVLAN
jgi:acyl-CoA synthetase (NDP forming)